MYTRTIIANRDYRVRAVVPRGTTMFTSADNAMFIYRCTHVTFLFYFLVSFFFFYFFTPPTPPPLPAAGVHGLKRSNRISLGAPFTF